MTPTPLFVWRDAKHDPDGSTPLRLDFAYNATGQLTDITRYSDLAGTTTVALTSYGYDDAGRIDHLQRYGSGTNIANYTYTKIPPAVRSPNSALA